MADLCESARRQVTECCGSPDGRFGETTSGSSWPEGEILKVLDQSPPPYVLPTTTDRFQTLANTGSGFAHAREITRENGEQRGVSEGENADIGGVALARPRSESAPVLAGVDEKNQPITVGFWNSGGGARNRTRVRNPI